MIFGASILEQKHTPAPFGRQSQIAVAEVVQQSSLRINRLCRPAIQKAIKTPVTIDRRSPILLRAEYPAVFWLEI